MKNKLTLHRCEFNFIAISFFYEVGANETIWNCSHLVAIIFRNSFLTLTPGNDSCPHYDCQTQNNREL